MDGAEYNKKAEELLNTRTYKKIPEDPIKKQKKHIDQHSSRTSRLKVGLNEEDLQKIISHSRSTIKFLWVA